MTKRNIALYLMVFLVVASGAQTRPEFSGTWKQNIEKSPTKSTWLKSYVNKIELRDTSVKVATTTVGDRGETRTRVPIPSGRKKHHKVATGTSLRPT